MLDHILGHKDCIFFRRNSVSHFTIAHYAGLVHYNADGWVEKNRDQVDQSLIDVLKKSTHPLVVKLFSTGINSKNNF